MSTQPPKPIKQKVPGLRQRYRARDGWRVWWEPSKTQRLMGAKNVELRADQPTASVRKAKELNLKSGTAPKTETYRARTAPNSIEALRAAYLKSPQFLTKKPKTRFEYEKDIIRIVDRWQGTDVRKLTKPKIYSWYEELYAAHGVWVSKRLVRMLSILLSYAELKGIIPTNPVVRMRMITPKSRNRTIDWAEFDALDAAAQDLELTNMRLAMHLAMFMGGRVTDVFNARAASFIMRTVDLDDGTGPQDRLHWRIVRSKDSTKQRLSYLVVHDDVLPLLSDALRAATAPQSPLVTRDHDARPFNDTSFPKEFARIREKAAETCPSVYDIQFRDFRRSFSNNSRHAGVVSDDVDDALGNTSGTDANLRQTYMPASDARAAKAILAIEHPRRSA
jgi:hypothetical protein